MLITAAIVLVVSNLVDLSAIASVGSACSLVIFLLVGTLRRTGSERRSARVRPIVLVAIAATAVVLVVLRGRHAAELSRDVHRDHRDRALPRRRSRHGLEARVRRARA